MENKEWVMVPVEPTPVAYLDVGAGGYMDLGTDLTEDQVGSLPWGRHILAIVGTYGADGYVPAEQKPAPDVAGLVEQIIAEIDYRQEQLIQSDYLMDSEDCIEAIHQWLTDHQKREVTHDNQ